MEDVQMVFPTPYQDHVTYNRQPFVMPHGRQQMGRGSGAGLQQMLQQLTTPNAPLTELAGKSVGGISKALGNLQQVLKVVETTAPIVKQYGPMVKNLPAMYRMLKAFKDIDLEDEGEASQDSNSVNSDEASIKQPQMQEAIQEEKVKKSHRTGQGQSIPKLYI